MLGVYLVNFDCIKHIYFKCNQHAMFTICILFTLTVNMWRGIKTIFRHQKLYRAETAPPVLKFLDPPLLTIINFLHLSKNDNSSLSPFSAHSKYLSTNGFFVSSGPVLLLILTTLTSLFYIKERFLVTITLKQSNGTF